MINFLKKHLDKEDSDLKKNNHAIKNQESQKKPKDITPKKNIKRLGWKAISNMEKEINDKEKTTSNLYYNGFITNASYDRHYTPKYPSSPEYKYEDPNDSYWNTSDRESVYIEHKSKYDWESNPVVPFDRFSLAYPAFTLIPIEKLGTIDIPPLPTLPKVSNIEYKNKENRQYFFLERLKSTHKNASKLIQQKNQEFQKIKDECDSVWERVQAEFSNKPNNNLAIENFLTYVLERHPLPYFFENKCKIKNDSKSSILIIQFTFPDYTEHEFKTGEYKSSSDWNPKYKYASKTLKKQIVENSLYSLIIRAAYICSKYLPEQQGKIIVVNVEQNWFDPSTGQPKFGIIASVQGEKGFFSSLDPLKLDSKACFKTLKGISSRSLQDISPVRPIMSLQKDDSRLIDNKDLNLEEDTNLAAMPWEDFEHLVAQLFELEFSKSGIEVKVTQASRDRGVDAILFDPDPLKGGKYILQAKRYTRTVDVSSVRDLYGTVMNEGANRGILITTSSYGPDSYEFAKDKPITLIDGSNLLSIFEKHQMKYRIDLEEARFLNSDN